MLQVIYTSKAVQGFSQLQLEALLDKARRVNQTRDITGMLLYDEGDFLQILEGPAEAVMDLFTRIERDPGHSNVRLVSQENVTAREFGDWGMAFARTRRSGSGLPGHSDYDGQLVDFAPTSSKAIKLMFLFQEGILRPISEPGDGRVNVTFGKGAAGSRAVTTNSTETYLLELARAVALSMPDVGVSAELSREQVVRFNVRRKLNIGEVELF